MKNEFKNWFFSDEVCDERHYGTSNENWEKLLDKFFDQYQPDSSKREDSEYGAKCDFGILKSEMRCSEHSGD